MAVDKAKIEALANQLLAIAAMVSPQAGAVALGINAVKELFKAGTEFNGLLKEIMEQTDLTADQVMADVIADYAASSSAARAAINAP